MSSAQIMRDIKSLGISQPEVARICAAIVIYLEGGEFDRQLHLTYSIFKRLVSPRTDSDLLAAVQYLTGAKANLLEMRYEFLDEDGEYHPISRSVVSTAAKLNALEHPVSGELVQDYQASVLVYFTPTEHARNSLQKRGG
ncbi:hypothetical protein [Ralstonia sp. 25mfcol4.1]|uniref:hypothetical protein n=1 Tax=Ralstonia sp. 25mfcol4.1 TaxID=1761899 RepID=UPI00048FFFFC|nr:hypothetical protein [Ralstonia sp. 25mfcol4.1]